MVSRSTHVCSKCQREVQLPQTEALRPMWENCSRCREGMTGISLKVCSPLLTCAQACQDWPLLSTPSTLTFTCHTGVIFTATAAHLPTLSPDCQSAAGRLLPNRSISWPKAPDHISRHKHRHGQREKKQLTA